MKKILSVFFLCVFHSWVMGQTTKTIGGTSTAIQPQPFGMGNISEWSASIYLNSEIGGYCNITKLGWYVGNTNGVGGDPNTCPIKIYLKVTSWTNMLTRTWVNLTDGATLVYDGVLSFPTPGVWQTIDIADFDYYSGSSNQYLMVLCKSDFGWNGSTTYPSFRYPTALNATTKHECWDNWMPNQNGVVNNNRPQIQITYISLTGVYPPSGFITEAVSPSEVNLKWTRNPSNDDVMVAFNTTNTFGTPSGSYNIGDAITGGGTVIHIGPDTTFNQTNLPQNSTFYYMAWSVHPSVPTYSVGKISNSTTGCEQISMYPYVTNFESSTFPPTGWSNACVPWIRSTSASGYGAGASSAKANFFSISFGDFVDLVSPTLDTNYISHPVLKFDHAYAYDTIAHPSYTAVDSLQLWSSYDNGVTYTWKKTWAGGPTGPLNTGGSADTAYIPTSSQWATKRFVLPPGTNRVILRGLSEYGNNLYLDNITFYDTICSTRQVPYSEDFDHYTPPTTGCLSVTDNNNDLTKWITTGSCSRSSPNAMYINQNISHDMNDWFFTPGLNLYTGTTYAVNFYFKSGDPSKVEKLELKWGNAPNAANMTRLIWNKSDIQCSSYACGYGTFTVSTSGTYYLGWHGYSVANMSFISVDDIHVGIASATWIGSNSEDWNDPGNWSTNIVPDLYQNVTIPSESLNDPVLSITGLNCRDLTINSGRTLTITGESTITISGNLKIQSGASFHNEGYVILKGNLLNLNPN